MDKQLKAELLDLLQQKDLRTAVTRLLDFLPAAHSAALRTRQLEKRLREFEGRMEMGTLSPQDISRVQARITGGLREIILDYQPDPAPSSSNSAPAAAAEKDQEKQFKLSLRQTPRAKEPTEPEAIGFHGDIAYNGSPSKKEASLTLAKSYGSSYHIAVQAVRKCGMNMEKGDRAGGRIFATTTGNTIARFGEEIHLWITPLERARTRIHVVVDSANPETVFDLGRHQQKLSALLHQLRNG